ncbi:RNA polymerase subunit sigma-70 [Terrihabitans rhizophilus]|uniref:RNA polymerase subunit sigma-70 n=1 Tax=Terrihabitans rhizophilus TaxID=3092662 RepID=A0ABU4RL15_9HYPH|nr:RNA polymerase subunit sigma-70 [Terrihabitans sp. PJ23]MDX6805529.1 RNA polymerase subunit sigma-70 [Terrihabitans sp. PJ23]
MTAVPKTETARGLRPVARLDIMGGGQVVVQDGYAFVGHMSPPEGTSIIDVRDPWNPVVVARIPPPSRFSHTHKVRVAGHLMITNVERHRRHFYRKGEGLPAAGEVLSARFGRPPTEAELAAEIGVAEADMADLREGAARGYDEGGFRVWNIADPANPRLLSTVRTGGIGVHRFDMDRDFAYISTEMEGYVGNILVTYDLADPAAPREVSRWWMPGQHVAGGETPSWKGQRHRLHHALRQGDRMWAACWYAGAYVIDISDITRPTTIGSFNYHPPFPEPTHTLMRLPEPVGGREIALIVDEEHDHVPGQPHGFIWIMDASDPANLTPISTFHVSERGSPYAGAGGRFGAHQFQEKQVGSLVYATWFAGGVRVIDIADPEHPVEVGFYLPEPYPGHVAPQSNDVDVDERGFVYILDRDRGFEIVTATTPAAVERDV